MIIAQREALMVAEAKAQNAEAEARHRALLIEQSSIHMFEFSTPPSAAPVFLGLPLHRRRVRALELEPVLRPAGNIARTQPLRDDAL